MIPKIIHYVWVGGKPLNSLAQKCFESWKKYCPDYEIKLWNEETFDINQNRFCKEAYECKKWAFVSDYIRLKVLYEYGGVYVDADVEIVKNIDKFLSHHGFSGFECTGKVPTGIMASEKGNKWIKLMLDYYKDRPFIKGNGELEDKANVLYMSDLTEKEYKMPLDNKYHDIGDYVFYPYEYFCPIPDQYGIYSLNENTYTIHHFMSSWVPNNYAKKRDRKRFLKRVIAFFIGKKTLNKFLEKRKQKKLATKQKDKQF